MKSIPNMQNDLMAKAEWVWRETLEIYRRAPEVRLASSLSPIEIFVALYYGGILKFNPKNPFDENRDRCIISKGHGSICMYPILADLGFFPKSALQQVGQSGSFLGGIPDPNIPGYETINGSLGHGLGVATGMALALKRQQQDSQVFVILGDGELHEGANWEAMMFASHHQLDNLNMIIDDNRISMLDHTQQIVSHGDLSARLAAFGWQVDEVDGHNLSQVHIKLDGLKYLMQSKPKVLIAKTLKGRGVEGLENASLAHILGPKPDVVARLLEPKA